MKQKAKELQDLLRDRIKAGHIHRWRHVDVMLFDDAPDDYKQKTIMQPNECLIRWNGNKKNGIHNEEFRTFPVEDINKVIARNTERFKSERSIYK